jgi:hypothetical protein
MHRGPLLKGLSLQLVTVWIISGLWHAGGVVLRRIHAVGTLRSFQRLKIVR